MSAAVEAHAASGPEQIGWKTYLMLALVALALFLPGRARLPPVDRDEARYLQATRQMLVSHDFIDIRFQDKPRNLQPVGVYWLEAASASLFGGARAPVWAYRLPSLIAALLAVLLTARLGAMLFGRRAGVGAGLLLAGCALLSFESRMAKIDACLLASVVAAQGALLKAYLGQVRGAGRLNAAAFWTALAVGLLLKGPIVLIVSGTTALGLVLIERRAAWLKRLHAGWGGLLMLAIAAPWFVAIGIKTHGAFFDKAVRQNLLGKVGRGEQHHGQPPGYYLVLANLTFWPGALATALATPWTWRMRTKRQVRFLLCWVLPTWLMYEAIGTKLPHYVLPLYPALACLACGAATSADGWRAGAFGRAAAVTYGALWLVISGALASAGAALVWRYAHHLDPVAIGFGMVAFGACIATLVLVRRGAGGAASGAAIVGAAVIYAGLYAHVLPGLQTIWIGPRLAALAGRVRPCPTSVLASTRFAEPSLVFLEQGETRLVDARSAADLIASNRACAMAAVSARQLPVFTAQADADGVALKVRGEVDGVSYSTGERLRLLLFTAAEAGGAPGHPQPFQAAPKTPPLPPVFPQKDSFPSEG
ncbi:glycosyltransferase family 39 protein [Caulobacter sp. S45]|uniref:ArnT family glycosyltransferase n=1 Tax=Caulobacter sp. S45 TaxID=1641861 RepID=UPI001C2D5320|nr:glycosyltransferase family 39 protein [Caulobacter sp. S45]